MRRARLLDYLSRICAAVGGASKARGRRRRALSPSLLGALGDTVTPMAALWDGDNAGRALLGRVLGCVLPEGGVPIAVGLSDGTGAVVLSVHPLAPPPLGDPSDLPQPLAASRALRGHVGVGGGPAGRGETADGSRSPLAFLELFPETLPLTHAPSLKEHRRQKAAPGPGDAGHTALLPLLHRESL